MSNNNPNTHTLYSHYFRQQETAIDQISNLRRFLFPDDGLSKEEHRARMQQNATSYLVTVNPAESPLQDQINALDNYNGGR